MGWFGGGDDTVGYRWTMVSFAIVAAILFFVTFAMTKERVVAKPRPKLQLKEDILDLFGNRAWLTLFTVGLSFVTLTTLKQGATMYYFTYFLDAKALAAAYMVVGTIGALIGAALTGTLTERFGRKKVMLSSLALVGLSSLAMYWCGNKDTTAVFVLGFITEFGTGPIITLFFAMLADCADFSEWKTNRRATGLVYSAGTLSIKFGSGIGAALIGWVLASHGYAANTVQSADSLSAIRMLISTLPAAGAVVAAIAFMFYPLSDKLLREVKEALEKRRESNTTPA